mmetsp:Transcript_81217/g.230105  ORF Transcript_81217/g.230105 Transcript_81217/m.230105 type:complete len:231 (+) Transcript_81217:484-1176(+)
MLRPRPQVHAMQTASFAQMRAQSSALLTLDTAWWMFPGYIQPSSGSGSGGSRGSLFASAAMASSSAVEFSPGIASCIGEVAEAAGGCAGGERNLRTCAVDSPSRVKACSSVPRPLIVYPQTLSDRAWTSCFTSGLSSMEARCGCTFRLPRHVPTATTAARARKAAPTIRFRQPRSRMSGGAACANSSSSATSTRDASKSSTLPRKAAAMIRLCARRRMGLHKNSGIAAAA